MQDYTLPREPIQPIVYYYPPKGRWIVVDIYQDTKRRGIYLLLFAHPERDSCFSIYQIRLIKKCCFNFFFWNFRKTTRHFSLGSQNISMDQVTGTNQNAQKLPSTDLVNTKSHFWRILQINLEGRENSAEAGTWRVLGSFLVGMCHHLLELSAHSTLLCSQELTTCWSSLNTKWKYHDHSF